jgi:hypothetical protein
MKLVNNEYKYYEFIRALRTHKDNMDGFLEHADITPAQQNQYMKKHGQDYFVCLNSDNEPVGWIGDVDNDIRVCTCPNHKRQGVAGFMVRQLAKLRPQAKSKVLLDNVASIRLFNSCGFCQYKKDEFFRYFKNVHYNRPKSNPYKIVSLFEEEVAHYTGAAHAVAVDSCTNALFLCLMYQRHLGTSVKEITIPSKTYLSVPQSIMHAGFTPVFDSNLNSWRGVYNLHPFSIYDSAKRLTSGMYIEDSLMCLSFHIKKHLSIGKGGMILTDSAAAVDWLKKARYEGRSEKLYHKDDIEMLGWNMYMTPQQAAHGLALMQNYPLEVNDQEENNGYRDLTEFTLFHKCKKI